MNIYNEKFALGKEYYRYENEWKIPLEKKRAKRARAIARKEAFVPPAAQEEKIIIHNPALPLKLPTRPENMFAILNLNNTQYKVNIYFNFE
jgi:hypothetical protein